MECAIDTIAEVGYANASMARIAERAGISRGLISYHFAGKDELLAQVIITAYGEGAAFMVPRIAAEPTAAGQLRAYIESNLEYMRTHPARMVAIVEIVASGALAAGLPGINPDDAQAQTASLEELFRRGQADGEFRAFDPRVMARAVRSVIDGIPPHVADPDLDLDACAREVTTLFELATRNPGAAPATTMRQGTATQEARRSSATERSPWSPAAPAASAPRWRGGWPRPAPRS